MYNICSSSTASSSQGMQTQSEVYEPTSAAWGRSKWTALDAWLI